MFFKNLIALVALLSVPLMAAGQSDGFPLSNDTSDIDLEQNDVETPNGIDLSSWIESTFLGVSDNPVREHANKLIIRLASAPDSTSERRPWRSIEDPERAGVFPFQPVSLNPLRQTNPLGENLMTTLEPGGRSCTPITHSFPTRDGDLVITYFETTCTKPDGRDYKWKLEIALFGPSGNVQAEFNRTGNKVKFLKAVTKQKLECISGEWESQAKLRYRRTGWFQSWETIYHNSLYSDITCP